MAKVNRAKVIAAAHKYLAKGDLKKAVREYEKVLREDPSDIRTKLKVADLLFRLGERERATAAFKEVAEFYASQGFLLKAVAVFKQVQKLKPHDIEVHLALAGLYQQIGLINDAIVQYREAIALQDQAGLTLDRLKAAQKMLELDPDNARLRVTLGEEFSREGMIEEAVHEFRTAAEVLKRNNQTDEYILVAERLLYHQPDDFDISRDLAALYIGQHDSLKALSRLQVCYRARPNDPDVLDLLAQVFEFTGQPQKAVAVLKALARVYDRTGLIRERDEVHRRVLKLQPGDDSARRALQFVPESPVETGSEIEFESSPASAREEILVPEDEEIEIEEIGEDTSPEVQLPASASHAAADQSEEPSGAEEPSRPAAIEGVEAERTLVDRSLAASFDLEPTPSPIGVDLTLIPPEYQDDIQNLEFLIDVDLRDDARELLDDIRKRAGELPILARYEALLRG